MTENIESAAVASADGAPIAGSTAESGAAMSSPTATGSSTTTVVLCGVGGQGTILAAQVLAEVCLVNGQGVKVSEIHGMAQRGGSVITVVRMGDNVLSMVADEGCADCIVSFETTEALRNMPYLKQGGALIVNDEAIKPLPVLTGKAAMPAHARADLAALGATMVPADRIAREAGNAKTGNVVLMGALAEKLDFPFSTWEEVIARLVPPKTVEANLAALRKGHDFARGAAEESIGQ